ncbi:hypothetical protein [Corynebacterium casei]|uniref:hypothetical protein n=1 Tax=Corynebacterium casei TaxID=160386 RepID=UPI003FD577B0
MPIPAPFTRSQSGAAGITFRTDRERPRILSGYVLVLSVFAGLVNALYWSGRQQPDDWSSLWIAGILVNNGNSDHIYDFDPTDFAAWSGSAWQEVIVTNDLSAAPHPFVHIPGVAYAVAPFTDVLSFEASVVWLTALCGACLPFLLARHGHCGHGPRCRFPHCWLSPWQPGTPPRSSPVCGLVRPLRSFCA